MSAPISDLSAVPPTSSVQVGKGTARGESSRALSFAAPAGSRDLPAAGAPDATQLQKAVEALNRHFSEVRTDLKFTVDKALGVIVVAVVDARDGRVLRQIPSEEVLRIARVLDGRSSPSLVEAVA